MFASRALTGAIAIGAAAAMSIAIAAPASAATLPAGQVITVIDSFGWQNYQAAPDTAALTPVGNQEDNVSDFITGVDVDQDGYGYAVAAYSEGGGYLYKADANAGTLADDEVEIDLNFGDVEVDADSCSAIDYTDGVIYAACYLDAEDFEATYVGTVDPTTGLLTPVVELAGEDYLNITSIAVDPITGQLYGFSTEFGIETVSAIWILSEDDGASFVSELDRPAYGADFDRDGQLWVTTNVFEGSSEFPDIYSALATVSLTDGSNPFLEKFTTDGVEYEDPIQPITVWGTVAAEEAPPVLAATGSTMAPAAAVIAAGVLLFGALLAAGTAIARRRSLES